MEKLLTNRRGKITSRHILKLLIVFGIMILFQCCTLLLTKDFILLNNISSTKFLFISFTLSGIICSIQQKSWKVLSYINSKRMPMIIFQSILYSFSYLCLIHGITTSGILQYYSMFNVVQIFNVFSNINKIFSSSTTNEIETEKTKQTSIIARMQLLISLICFVIGIYILVTNHNQHLFVETIGIISLMLYHLIKYLREQHYEHACKHHKSFKRIQPLGLLSAAFIILSLSILSNISNISLPHHNHKYDIKDTQFANDHRLFMHHSANHDIDTSAKLTHRLLLSDTKPLEDLAEKQEHSSLFSGIYFIWSMIIYIIFVILFILLNPHLSNLQIRLFELVFADLKLNNIIQSKKSKQSDTNKVNKPIADILLLTVNNENIQHQTAPRWSKLIILYQLISAQCLGIVSYLLLVIFGVNELGNSKMILFGAFIILIGNECSLRSAMKLQFPFGDMVINKVSIAKHGGQRGLFSSIVFGILGCFSNIPSFIEHLRDTPTSRRIFIFLTINFLFMLVEFFYGYLSNSLGLMSDAFHMLFDCIALVIGLLASYLGSPHATNIWLNKNKYSWGYGKIKVMSGFINAIFLIYIGLSVLIESFERIIHPPHIHTDQLFIVCVLGLFVNLIGLFFFHDAHMMGHEAHGDGTCSHSHGHGHNHGNDHNIRGIFLHILADTLGSVGVIISSLLIYFFDLTIFDALCSVFIAILIFITVYPLIKSTSKILLQETPQFVLMSLKNNNLSKLLSSVKGIIGYHDAHFWECEPGELVGSIKIQIDDNANEQQLLAQIHHILKQRFGIKHENNLTIQIEKQSFVDECDSHFQIIPIRNTTKAIDIERNNHHHSHKHDHHDHHGCNHNHNHNHLDHSHSHTHHHDNMDDESQHSNGGDANSSFVKIEVPQCIKRTS